MRTSDWEPMARKHRKDRGVILHTDGARAYRMKVDGVIHDHVIHKKKPLMLNGKVVKNGGKTVWVRPKYVKMFKHKLPSGRILACKGGTQIIDRAWAYFREHLKSRSSRVGSVQMKARVRSAQWEYWMRDEDLWLKTGEMLHALAI